MARRLVFIILLLFVIWIVAGIAARRSILSLLPNDRHSLVNSKSNYNDFFFGIRIRTNDNSANGSYFWFTENENSEVRRLLENAYLGECLSSDNFFMETDAVKGGFYIIPRWVHTLSLTFLLSPFMHRVEMFYWPSKDLLYLSEDIEELSYDFSRGLNITNVPPRVLHME